MSARRRAIGAALVAVLVWGASFAASKQALAELSPTTLLFTRTLLAALLVSAWSASRGRLVRLPRADWPLAVLLAFLGLVATQLLQAHALVRSTSANTAWLITLNPVVTALLANRIGGERLRGKVLGIALAFGGALLVLSQGVPLAETIGLPSTRGDALTLVSTLTWALYTIYGRDLVTRHSPAAAMPWLLGIALATFTVPFALGGGVGELRALSPTGWFCIVYLGAACSGGAFVLYYAALETLEASQVAAYIYLEPLVAQALSVALLGEPLRATTLAGGAAIFVGVALVTRVRPASSS